MDVEFLRYRFENGYHGIVVKNKFKIGIRHLQMLYMFVCAMVLGAMRGSTGIAVLAMADVTRRNDTYIQIYDWDRLVQGKILSSFLFGYALMLIPAELYLKKICGKIVLSVALIINGALTVAMPTIANRVGCMAVYNAQLWLGMTQACLTPANQSLLARWLPPNEKGVFSFIIQSGVLLGIIIAMPISGLISESRLGWELVFYSQAMLTLSMATVWVMFTASKPDTHEAIGDLEKEYLSEVLSCYRKKAMNIPWRSILRSKEFWASAIAHAASNAVFVFYLMDVPAFMQALKIPLRDTGWQAMLPFLSLWLAYVTSASSIEWICRILQVGFHFNVTYFRKLINGLGASGVIAGLTLMPYLVLEAHWSSCMVLTMTLGSLGFQLSGFLENFKDMSQNYSGTLVTLSSALAAAVGALVPVLTGILIGDDLLDVTRWRVMFLTLASFYLICNVVYTVVATSNRQPWDGGILVKTKFGCHNRIIDSTQLELEEISKTKSNLLIDINESDV